MPSIGTQGGTLPSGLKSLKVKHQAFVTVVQQDLSSLLQPGRLSQITIPGLEPRVYLDVANKLESFLADTGATYSFLTSYSRAFSSQICAIWGATGKIIIQRFT